MATGAAANAPAPTKQKSKAYLSSVAIQSDAIKYRQKYKELKRKVHEIELENDKLQATTLRIKGNIQRLRLERAYVSNILQHSILYERLEADMRNAPPAKTSAIDPVRDAKASAESAESKEQDVSAEPSSKMEDDAITSELEQTL
ncbi:hypothetical protein MEQU1_003466 [Malassezia equina]|uniref:INO80 complex subunit F domain-containing protein n=1 Tax=Malassezia equina TaxID=1381935 RepID=A0AAF0EEC7_9BASI|nr:hypothetical protein MEQU1_003466 [Malassezia equina]